MVFQRGWTVRCLFLFRWCNDFCRLLMRICMVLHGFICFSLLYIWSTCESQKITKRNSFENPHPNHKPSEFHAAVFFLMGLTCSYRISHTGNLAWQLKIFITHEIDLKWVVKKHEGSDTFTCNWQMAAIFANAAFISAAWYCFFYSRAFFDCFSWKVSRGQDGLCRKTVFSLCLLILLSFPFPSTFAKQSKQFGPNGHMVTYGGCGCRSDVVSDVVHITWDFQATSLLWTCRPLEKAAEQLSFQQSWFAYCCLKKRMFWQSLWRPKQSAHISTLAPNTSTRA